jgi:D-alanyl-D-alanine carboxypeptidase
VRFKASEALRFLGGLLAAVLLLGLLVLRVTSCAPLPATAPGLTPTPTPGLTFALPPPPPAHAQADCSAHGWELAANINASSLRGLPWAPFRRPEFGWETYAPLIAREIATACPPDTPAFASAFAAWQKRQGAQPSGLVSEVDFIRLKGVLQTRRPFVLLSAQGVCPAPANEATLVSSRPDEGYGAKQVQLRPAAMAAYRRMVEAARAASPEIAADPRYLSLFSGYRSPAADAARCATEGNCDGVVRANCSPHRTGLAVDLYVGQTDALPPDSSADPNRLAMTRGPAYQWLVKNADRFGFVNYPFEPWHWEWTGEQP